MTAKSAAPKTSAYGIPLGPGAARQYGSPWSPEKNADLSSLWIAGVRAEDIAIIMNLPYVAMVYQHRKRLGLPDRPTPGSPPSSQWRNRLPASHYGSAAWRRIVERNPKKVRYPAPEVAIVMPVSIAPAQFAKTERDYQPEAAKIAARHRKCLRCKKGFASEGSHNRMCDNCREKSW